MAKALEGLAMLGGAVLDGAAMFLLASTGVGAAALPYLATLMGSLVAGGIAMEAGAIASALTSNRGEAITTRQTAAARQVIYGQQRIGGVEIYRSTTGSSHDQFNYIIVISGHEVDSLVNLYLDGRQVHWLGSGAGYSVRNGVGFGGIADSNTYTGPNGVQYNFGGTGHSGIYCEARFGDQSEGDVIAALTANDPNWAESEGGSPWVGGCAYIYLKVEYNSTLFPSEPEIRITVNGKNTIYDPRTQTTGFTTNWALLCADVITDPIFGLGDNSVNQDQLIAAANVCDELVACAAGQEARYTTNYHTDTTAGPGDILAAMMIGAAGRLSRIGGEWYLWPAYWQGPSFTFDDNSLTGALEWMPYRPFRELINRVNGTYIAPTYPYNIAGNLYDANGFYDGQIQNNFPFAWQSTNFPQYAADTLHGYASDQYLTADGGNQLPRELTLQTVISVSQAQRVAKINLLRNRQQGSGTLNMNLSAWGMQPCDVMQFTFPAMGWTDKVLEVIGVNFTIDQSGEDNVPSVRASMQVIETSSSVYEWSSTEELTVYDVPATPTQQPYVPSAPTNLTLTSGLATAVIGADGVVIPRVAVSWSTPQDATVTQVQVQYQQHVAGNTTWLDAGLVDVANNSTFVSGVIAGATYNFRIRALRPSGVPSVWVETDSYTVSTTLSTIASEGINPNSPYNTSNNATVDSIAEGSSATIRVYGPGGVGSSFTRYVGATAITMNAADITGEAFSTDYFVVYNTVSATYLALTDYNSTLADSYVFVGAVVTCTSTYTGGTGGTGGGGTGSTGGGSVGGGGGATGGGRIPINQQVGN